MSASLVLSGFAEKQYAINMLRAGASGYLAKDQAPRNSCAPFTRYFRDDATPVRP